MDGRKISGTKIDIMPVQPLNAGQLALIIASAAFFLGGAAMSVMQGWLNRRPIRIAAKSMDYWAICLAAAAVIWHCLGRSGSWLPLEDNFETLATLGILLGLFVMYIQRTRPIPGLDWFLLPIVVLLLVSAAVFGTVRPNSRPAGGWWAWTHVLSSYGGAMAFAVAASVGCVYLLLSARLRDKRTMPGPNMGSLERLERVTQISMRLGFALLTLGMITGLVIVLDTGPNNGLGPHWMTSPKVLLATVVWVIYALVLHTPISSGVRGRRSAMLSILGFVLMFGTLIAVQFMPRGQ
jgi:ABC-type uncharacterized transport system permease subunit